MERTKSDPERRTDRENYNVRIGLIDVDGHNYPNLPLMKISAYHKAKRNGEWKCIDQYKCIMQGDWKHKTRCVLKEGDKECQGKKK